MEEFEAISNALKHYGVTNEEDFYILRNPRFAQCENTSENLRNKLEDNPDTNHLILFVITGHGMNEAGQQVLLINEYDESTKFYKRYAFEA